jgi:hypothetical protein
MMAAPPFSRWVKTQRYNMNRADGSYDFAKFKASSSLRIF